jgi:hypothetical protein
VASAGAGAPPPIAWLRRRPPGAFNTGGEYPAARRRDIRMRRRARHRPGQRAAAMRFTEWATACQWRRGG